MNRSFAPRKRILHAITPSARVRAEIAAGDRLRRFRGGSGTIAVMATSRRATQRWGFSPAKGCVRGAEKSLTEVRRRGLSGCAFSQWICHSGKKLDTSVHRKVASRQRDGGTFHFCKPTCDSRCDHPHPLSRGGRPRCVAPAYGFSRRACLLRFDRTAALPVATPEPSTSGSLP
jgi:hypothetical protein